VGVGPAATGCEGLVELVGAVSVDPSAEGEVAAPVLDPGTPIVRTPPTPKMTMTATTTRAIRNGRGLCKAGGSSMAEE
jgi:hypothetical protein